MKERANKGMKQYKEQEKETEEHTLESIKESSTCDIDEIKNSFKNEVIRPDDSRVLIAEMQINAIRELSNDSNEVFSQLSSDEVFNVSRAYVFADSPLPSVSERLSKRGIDFSFSLPILEHFLDENIKHRHKVDRKRVTEYIDALKAVQPKQNQFQDDPRVKTLMSRMI